MGALFTGSAKQLLMLRKALTEAPNNGYGLRSLLEAPNKGYCTLNFLPLAIKHHPHESYNLLNVVNREYDNQDQTLYIVFELWIFLYIIPYIDRMC